MPEYLFTTRIGARPDAIFDVLMDLRHYGNWLPHSAVFKGTRAISEGPIAEGTRYTERSLFGTREGMIVRLRRPLCIAYHQPMSLQPAWLGRLDIEVTDTLTDLDDSTELSRRLRLVPSGPVRFAGHAVGWAFSREIKRVHAHLKAYVERA
ncbi:Polyketide cyclase / dehydrase and lipid transport [Luteibacter sp. UNC138MFCol5.1]|uniref:SRPBCC family protein n=1 Tax=Luteibacter sp. UNC138MFCol5.1 TaxID=1502774 RepID=UPI0008B9C0E6|nr:SRPBCC family protein [Luteibacter sp. UNC138MFCol5.1]SEO93777.1 Polyketide cyclase / dehydrase and lipid transport [Luteibacter sp. UNC138MFCol5.1]